ncbi:unnamed protein product [Rotaria sp. Silwood2]|nr:unnamed protein product [Rotaria sp. Silwood2]CAF2511618.1 unnamed protein product [Rotaria sp. Silwood2]CAF2888136.1 unnamed protein product [Rotaria sp. Silwood2]
MSVSNVFHEYRKWFGLVWLIIELNLLGGNILGFSALFDILPKYGIYSNLCVRTTFANTSNARNKTISENCDEQTGKYQLALTIGIWFYNLMPFFLGYVINYFGCRFLKLVSIDYLVFIHTVFISISSVVIVITSFVYCGYFSCYRGLVSSIIAGASISSTMWFSIFQVVINDGRTDLRTLSIIWTVFVIIMIGAALLFMDWRFRLLNLPYGFVTNSEPNKESRKSVEIDDAAHVINMSWYRHIVNRVGVWQHLLSPIYIFVVLYLSVLLLPTVFLPVTWFPWVMYVTNENEDLSNRYTLIFNLSTIAALIICPCSGALLDFRAHRSNKQRLFNIALMQTITWCTSVAVCIVRMFNTTGCVIAVIILNCTARSLIVGGSQAVIASFFPSEYIGTLTGVLWTSAAIFSSIQYGLLPLVEAVDKSWRAWAIILALIVVMASHWIQMWYLFFTSKSTVMSNQVSIPFEKSEVNGRSEYYAYDNDVTQENPNRD